MIDYGRLDRSINFYETRGFSRIESPWTVTEAISNVTNPKDTVDWKIQGKDKALVASGEQSFLYLYLKGFLPPGRFQTITPCFRNEPFDLYHSKYFIKNELIITDKVTTDELFDVISYCQSFFEGELCRKVDRVNTEKGVDLVVDGIELGSYGISSCEFLQWIYATGLAEPRFSMIKNKLRR